MKRGVLRRKSGLSRGTKLRVAGKSEVSETKRNIQALLREIVIRRDGGCILRAINAYDFLEGGRIGIARRIPSLPPCNGYDKNGELILQGDHLITRANSATYADPRLVVCVCKGHHGWKSVGSNARKKQYDEIVRTLLPKDRVALWDRCEAESWRPSRKYQTDWVLAEIALKNELRQNPPLQ